MGTHVEIKSAINIMRADIMDDLKTELDASLLEPQVFGMAIPITEQNREKISVVNGGVIPEVSRYGTWYFVFLYDEPARICTIEQFFEQFQFIGSESLSHFVPITWRL